MDLIDAMITCKNEREIDALDALAKLTGLQGKPLAALISARRGVGGVMSTPRAQLRAFGVAEDAAEMVASAACLARHLAREEAIGAPVLSAWDKVLAYVRSELAHEGIEWAAAGSVDTWFRWQHGTGGGSWDDAASHESSRARRFG